MTYTLSVTFPAPSPEAIALALAHDKIGFARAWRTQVGIEKDGWVTTPGLRMCVDYYLALINGMPPLPVVLTLQEVANSCSRHPRK